MPLRRRKSLEIHVINPRAAAWTAAAAIEALDEGPHDHYRLLLTRLPRISAGRRYGGGSAVLLGEMLGLDGNVTELLRQFVDRLFERTKFVVDSSSQIPALKLEEWKGEHKPAAA